MSLPPIADEKSLFLAAVEMSSASERQAYLDDACKKDANLRARVEALLQASAEPRQLLDAPGSLQTIMGQFADMEGAGTIIGAYKLLEQIGEGGMGLVFVAEQTQPVYRRVALKVIKPGMDSRQVIARFEAERQALALMDHPHIAHVFDGGTTQSGRPYFVMELVRGSPITQFCDDNRLTLQERLGLFHCVCQAVQHAHQKGIIHRDIKPSNVMVTSHDGTPVVKIIDFGIAKAIGQKLTDKTVYTQFAQFVGTPVYLSPEQAGLSGIDVDTRTDIYALGVLLYELLTGSTPFTQERLQQAAFDEMRRIIREEEPPRPSTRLSTAGKAASTISANRQSDPKRLRQACYGELDWIVMKALEKDRKRRYEMASAFAADVQRYLSHEPVHAHPPSLSYRLRKFVQRHRAGVLAAALVGLALVTGMVGMTWGFIHATQAEGVAIQEANQKEKALAAARKSQQEATDKLWWSLYERARAGRLSQHIGQRLGSLAALEEAARIRPDGRLRDEAIAAMALIDLRPVPGRYTAPPGTLALTYSHKGQLYARSDSGGMISIRRLADDQEVRSIKWVPIYGINLHLSPDERFVLGFGSNSVFGMWRVADGQPALRDTGPDYRAHAFRPDGKRLAVGRSKSLQCFDLDTGQEVKRFGLPATPNWLAYHPDNGLVAVGYYSSRSVSVYDTGSGALVTELPVEIGGTQVLAWRPDGQYLAVAGSSGHIQLWHVATKRRVGSLEGHIDQVTELAFHPDGDMLASHGWDARLILWQVSTGRRLLEMISIGALRFSPDGRWLQLTRDGNKSELLEITPSREYRTLTCSEGTGGHYDLGDISPDGRLLAVGMAEGARLWDLVSGREVLALPSQTQYVFFDARNREERGEGQDEFSVFGFRFSESREASLKTETRKPKTSLAPGPLSLLTSGSAGLRRWPLLWDSTEGNHPRLGTPEQLSSFPRARFARTPEGRTLVAVTDDRGSNQIIDLATGKVQCKLGSHPDGEIRALSGDGGFAASCGWHSDRVRLWDAVTGGLIREWVVGKRTFVFFTPDSRALVICRGDEFRFVDLETLKPSRSLAREQNQFPGWVAFSPDGRLMALEMAPSVIHLMEVATGRTVARLPDPHGDRATWQGFTPDGTRLVVVAGLDSAVHVWDLRAIRTRLKRMYLDWDWPEFPALKSQQHADDSVWDEVAKQVARARDAAQESQPPAPGIGKEAAPLPEPPVLAQARYYIRLSQWDKAAAKYARAKWSWPPGDDDFPCAGLFLIRGDSEGYNRFCQGMIQRAAQTKAPYEAYILARSCAMARKCPVDPAQAVQWASQAVASEPRSWSFHVLGLAQFRAGQVEQALQSFTKANVKAWRYSELNWFGLALVHHRLGHPDEARRWFDKGVQWLEREGPLGPGQPAKLLPQDWLEAQILRREAEEVLKIKRSR
jgi:serine/threonine protein kinase/WD40 repeat protein/tetratricopeptide (TPR) repeat protein